MQEKMHKKNNKFLSLIEQLVSFGFVGGIITVLSLLLYWGCVNVGVHYQIANMIGFVITVALAYALNYKFTFKNGKEKWSFKGLLKTYVSYSLTGLFMAAVLLYLWTQVLNVNEIIAPLLNLFFTIPVNFLLNKFWVFKGEQTKESFHL